MKSRNCDPLLLQSIAGEVADDAYSAAPYPEKGFTSEARLHGVVKDIAETVARNARGVEAWACKPVVELGTHTVKVTCEVCPRSVEQNIYG